MLLISVQYVWLWRALLSCSHPYWYWGRLRGVFTVNFHVFTDKAVCAVLTLNPQLYWQALKIFEKDKVETYQDNSSHTWDLLWCKIDASRRFDSPRTPVWSLALHHCTSLLSSTGSWPKISAASAEKKSIRRHSKSDFTVFLSQKCECRRSQDHRPDLSIL